MRIGLRAHIVAQAFLMMLCAMLLWAPGIRAQSSGQSSGKTEAFIRSVGATILKAAWPTARYDSMRLGGAERLADGGLAVAIRLHATSYWSDGPLWVDAVVAIDGSGIKDLRWGDYQAVVPPGTSVAAIGQVMSELADAYERSQAHEKLTPQERASLLVGDWEDRWSKCTYDEQHLFACSTEQGTETGSWSIRGDTLVEDFGSRGTSTFRIDFVSDDVVELLWLGQTDTEPNRRYRVR